MCTSGLLSTCNQQGEPKVAHKLFPTLPLEPTLELIHLGEHFGIDRDLLFDLFDAADDGGVITSVEDSRDHGIGVVVQEVSNQVHGDVTRVYQRSKSLGTTDVLDRETVEVGDHREVRSAFRDAVLFHEGREV